MSDQPQPNTSYTQPIVHHQQQRPSSYWHQHNGRGGFRGGPRGAFRGNTRGGFSRGRGRGRGGGGGGGYKQHKLDLDKTIPVDYSADTLQQNFEPYYSPLFSQDPWTNSS